MEMTAPAFSGGLRSCAFGFDGAVAVATWQRRRMMLCALLVVVSMTTFLPNNCHHLGGTLFPLVAADVQVAWTDLADLPFAVGETSAGLLQDDRGEPILVVVGYNPDSRTASAATMVLDINANQWTIEATRPCKGHHMAAVTVNNKLYLMGGYLDESTGKLQVYDPIANRWTLGPNPPFKTAAASATVLGDTIYYCGGVDNGNTKSGRPINKCAKFNVLSNEWQSMEHMPYAVHHASMATDGRYVYCFAGRNSFAGTGRDPVNYTQVYDPMTDAWRTRTESGGPSPCPAGRGGTGTAVFLNDHFYLIGGEVKCSQTWMGKCPNNRLELTSLGVLNRVDRYNPQTDTWDRALPGMSLARHGAYPVVGPAPNSNMSPELVVYVCAGGVKQGLSENTRCSYMRVVVNE